MTCHRDQINQLKQETITKTSMISIDKLDSIGVLLRQRRDTTSIVQESMQHMQMQMNHIEQEEFVR